MKERDYRSVVSGARKIAATCDEADHNAGHDKRGANAEEVNYAEESVKDQEGASSPETIANVGQGKAMSESRAGPNT